MNEGNIEDNKSPFNVEKVLQAIQPTYVSHETMKPEQKMRNNVRTSINMIVSKSSTWLLMVERKKADQMIVNEAINELVEKGIDKIKTIHTSEEESKLIREFLTESINKEKSNEEQGRNSGLRGYLEKAMERYNTPSKHTQ